jgi:hypothetical protein
MKKFLSLAVFSLVLCSAAFAQQQDLTPEEQEKKMNEFIQKKVERLESVLKLEYWQVFYVDSIFNHDYVAMTEEAESLKRGKVSNTDIYVAAQDKWADQIDASLRKVLNDEQWEKYLKTGAGKEAQAREKRKQKAKKAGMELKNTD